MDTFQSVVILWRPLLVIPRWEATVDLWRPSPILITTDNLPDQSIMSVWSLHAVMLPRGVGQVDTIPGVMRGQVEAVPRVTRGQVEAVPRTTRGKMEAVPGVTRGQGGGRTTVMAGGRGWRTRRRVMSGGAVAMIMRILWLATSQNPGSHRQAGKRTTVSSQADVRWRIPSVVPVRVSRPPA